MPFLSGRAQVQQDDVTASADAALVAAYRAGDRSAFDAIYEKYARLVFRYLYSLTSSRADAEDVTQETFIAAWEGLGSLRKVGALLPFLLGIAIRKWQSERRRKARRDRLAPSEPWDGQEIVSTTPGSAVETVLIRDAVRRLPDDDRAAFLLVAQAGFSQSEAASVLGLPVAVVKWRVTRATNRLRRDLQEESSRAAFSTPSSEVIRHVP